MNPAWFETLSEAVQWIPRASLDASLLILLTLIIQKVLGSRLSPTWRYALWIPLLVRLILPWTPQTNLSVYTVFDRLPDIAHSRWLSRNSGANLSFAGDQEQTDVTFPGASREHASRLAGTTPFSSREPYLHSWFSPDRLWPMFVVVWGLGVLIVLGLAITQSVLMSMCVRRHRYTVDGPTLSLLEDCKEELGVHAFLAVVETERVKSPVLFGVVRPHLLLPAGTLSSLDRKQLRHVFLHELGHLARYDIAVNWLMTALQAVHWFNPLIWYAFGRMRNDRESACDAFALSRDRAEDPPAYARTMIELLEKFATERAAPGLAGILENHHSMRRRITMIMNFRKTSRRISFHETLAIAVLTLFALTSAPAEVDRDKAEMMGRVEDFFANNFRDVTSRKSLEWGDVETSADGNRSIRYMYRARIWDRETIIDNMLFTFDASGKFLSHKNIEGYPKKEGKAADTSTLEASGSTSELSASSRVDEIGRVVDKIDLPFVDDPQVVGSWKGVDFVDDPVQFIPGRKQWQGEDLTFSLVLNPEGKASQPWWTWTKGTLIHSGDKTASAYTVKQANGATYMFLEWKNGDYIIRHKKPKYYVLQKE